MLQRYIHKSRQIKLMMAAIFLAVFLSGCSGAPEHTKVDFADPIGGSSIVTAADLIAFIEKGESDVAKLSADISLEGEMLRITKARQGITIDGNGFTISGAGACVLRLDEGCSITLNNITIYGVADAIGCLGTAFIGGNGAKITGIGNGIRSEGSVTILSGSSISCEANKGVGVVSSGLTLQDGASLTAEGPMGGISSSGDIFVNSGAQLAAYTEENYNAIKCGATLTLEDGSKFIAENRGSFHGAEISMLQVNGAVTIEAKGGKNSSGLFLFEQLENIAVIGSCEPQPRFEKGKGSITFVDKAQDLPDEPQPVATPVEEE